MRNKQDIIIKKEIRSIDGVKIEKIKLSDEINDMTKRLVFPSILEMLQNGSGNIVYTDKKTGRRIEKNNSVIIKSFDDYYKESRIRRQRLEICNKRACCQMDSQ